MKDSKNRKKWQALQFRIEKLELDPARRTSPISRKAASIYEPDSTPEVLNESHPS